MAAMVLYHIGLILTLSVAGVSFHFPSLFAALTMNVYVPCGRFEYDTLLFSLTTYHSLSYPSSL